MEFAVIYARYSCSNQTEQSIEGQLRVCEEFARRKNIIIVDSYIDRATTGTSDKRAEFQRMIKDSAKQTWKYVIVYQLDRFARNRYDSAIYKSKLKANKVKVLSAQENISDDASGILMESVLEGMAEYYSKELSQKTKRGMFETRQKGLFQGGHLLYGYKLDGRKIVIDEETSKAVKFMFTQYAYGFSIKDIVISLTNQGYLKNGKKFKHEQVYNILRNRKYTGVYKHEEEIIDNTYPAIISDELFEVVQKKIEVNRYGKSSPLPYLLKHKIKCGYCGMNINAESGTTTQGRRLYYYKCHGRKKRLNNCNKSIERKETLEEIVIDSIIKNLSKPKVIDDLVKHLVEVQEDERKTCSYLKVLNHDKNQAEIALNKIVKAIEQGIITDTTLNRMQELENEIKLLNRKIALEQEKLNTIVSESDLKKYFVKALKSEPQVLINYLVKEIKLFDDKMEIYINSPIRKSPDDSQGFFIFQELQPIENFNHFKSSLILKEVMVIAYI